MIKITYLSFIIILFTASIHTSPAVESLDTINVNINIMDTKNVPDYDKPWRDDGRCGPEFPLPNGEPAQCDPAANATKKGPCCREDDAGMFAGWCGNNYQTQCKCKFCFNYSDLEKLWRDDGRCGIRFPLPTGRPAQCDPTANAFKEGPCCSKDGWCGNTDGHCKCSSCVNFSDKLWRDDGRCGPKFPLPNGEPAQCDPTAHAALKGPCCSGDGWCGNADVNCKCSLCVNYSGTKCITSPNYPKNYPLKTWKMEQFSVTPGFSIDVTFHNLDIEDKTPIKDEEKYNWCTYDYLGLVDGNNKYIVKKLCGNLYPRYLNIPTSTASWYFNSDHSGTGAGFRFCYKQGKEIGKCVTSPGYPQNYPNNLHVRETLSVPEGKNIEITFIDFQVDSPGQTQTCFKDNVQFFDKKGPVSRKLCGDLLPRKITILSSTAFVLFQTDNIMTFSRGFKFCYTPVTKYVPPSKCGVENKPKEDSTCSFMNGTSSRISGGCVTSPHQYPWMVRLHCGGALITDRHILTAKHCIKPNRHFVKVKVHRQFDPRDYEEVIVKDVAVHSGVGENDIGILILAWPVNLGEKNIGTVCLPASSDKDYRGETATAMGWGMTHVGSGQSPVLKHVNLTVSQQEKPNYLFTEVPVLGGVPQDPCAGDSGGPLVHKDLETGRWTIIGTVYGGGYNCITNVTHGEGTWNKVTDHLQWIKSIIEK